MVILIKVINVLKHSTVYKLNSLKVSLPPRKERKYYRRKVEREASIFSKCEASDLRKSYGEKKGNKGNKIVTQSKDSPVTSNIYSWRTLVIHTICLDIQVTNLYY